MLIIRSGHFLTKISTLSLLLLSCTAPSRPLLSRGLPKSEREFYVVQNGFYMSWTQRQAFIEGKIQPGMNKEMVYQLIGNPDRTFKKDALWEYINNKGNTILGISFEKDTISSVIGNIN